MLCPNCRFENFEGEDTCANCGADLMGRDIPEQAQEYHATVLGEHLEKLGIGAVRLVSASSPVADAIRLMHQEDTDCLVVTDNDLPVGIFTVRDAAVKAVDK